MCTKDGVCPSINVCTTSNPANATCCTPGFVQCGCSASNGVCCGGANASCLNCDSDPAWGLPNATVCYHEDNGSSEFYGVCVENPPACPIGSEGLQAALMPGPNGTWTCACAVGQDPVRNHLCMTAVPVVL